MNRRDLLKAGLAGLAVLVLPTLPAIPVGPTNPTNAEAGIALRPGEYFGYVVQWRNGMWEKLYGGETDLQDAEVVTRKGEDWYETADGRRWA